MEAAGSAPSRMNPLLTAAAVAVIIASVSAVAAIFGVIPSAHSERQDAAAAQAQVAPEAARDAPRGEVKKGVMRADDPRLDGVARPESGQRQVERVASACTNCGVIESVRTVQQQGQGTGLGAVAGGLTGAVVGSQIGKGNGRTAMGVLGAVGGAYAGNAIEKNVRSSTSYRVSVRMDDGSLRTVYQAAPPAFGVGEKVRVINGGLAARG